MTDGAAVQRLGSDLAAALVQLEKLELAVSPLPVKRVDDSIAGRLIESQIDRNAEVAITLLQLPAAIVEAAQPSSLLEVAERRPRRRARTSKHGGNLALRGVECAACPLRQDEQVGAELPRPLDQHPRRRASKIVRYAGGKTAYPSLTFRVSCVLDHGCRLVKRVIGLLGHVDYGRGAGGVCGAAAARRLMSARPPAAFLARWRVSDLRQRVARTRETFLPRRDGTFKVGWRRHVSKCSQLR